ncbi:MAG TPA: heme lyase CcmF/NrfE family subunit [Phycisphaerales bacterium]|nr:heme lyase CcmF/NrfE family subunit [Phycisphaerales bacterium]
MVELGQFTLMLAHFLCSYAVIVDLLGVWRKNDGLMKSGRNATISCMLCLSVAIAVLLTLLVKSDFSVNYVAQHTSLALPLAYKLSALWAGASGSILLWLWMQVGFVLIVFCRSEKNNRVFAANARALANFVSVFFLIVMIHDENPFAVAAIAPADGAGLNPLLQHPAMVFHPPTLFVGYAGFIIPCAWAFAVMKHRDIHGPVPLYERTRNWILWSWVFLTIGIVLGAWWAYEELGWGGYWAWDPVENASLMPWLVGTALLHCSRTFRARSTVSRWLKILSILTFSLCVFGTYLTRSGLVSSVHAFPDPGWSILYIVLLVHLFIIAAVLMIRKHLRERGHPREGSTRGMKYIVYNNYLLLFLTFVVMVGTLFPFLSGLFSEKKISLQPEYFTKITSPVGAVFLLFLAICPHLLRFGFNLKWRPIVALIIAAGSIAIWFFTKSIAGAFLLIAAFAAVSLVVELIGYELKLKADRRNDSHRRRNARWYGARVVHIGVVMIFFGIAGSGGFNVEEYVALKPGQSKQIRDFKLVYEGLEAVQGPNFTASTANISVYRNRVAVADEPTESSDRHGKLLTVLRPSKAVYAASKKAVSEVSIRRTLASDLYLALTDVNHTNDLINLRILINPLINWIWIGGIVMVIGTSMVLTALYTRKHKSHQ